MKKFIITSVLFCQFIYCLAQKDKVKQDIVKVTCPDMPREKRPRVSVARFNLTAPTAPRDQFGENLATMLTNALQQVNCYNVLARLKDSSDMLDEQNFQQKGNVNKATAVKTNKMLGANVIVTGEVVKFEASSKSFGLTVLHTVKSTASIGINVTLVDPETRSIIDSRMFTAEKKTQGGMNVGIYVPYLGGVNAVSSAMSNPAVQSATEDAINQAVEFISAEREKIPMPVASAVPDNAIQSTITVQNIKYEQVSSVSSAVEKIPGVYSVNSDDFANNTANIVIDHSLKPKDLLDKILQANTGVKLSVQAVSKDGATLSAQ